MSQAQFYTKKRHFSLPLMLGVIHRAEKSIYVPWGNKENQKKSLFLIKAKNI